MKTLEGQTALVTGANSGIGAGIARALANAGARVGVNYVAHEDAARDLVDGIKQSGGQALALKADVSQENQVASMFDAMISTYGTVDILVSNAGIQKDSAFPDMTLDEWKAVLDVNLTGAFLCARAAAREFLRRGVVPERSAAAGKIIFTSSVHEVIPWAHHANYAASKGGIMMLMKTIAQELAPEEDPRQQHRTGCDQDADQQICLGDRRRRGFFATAHPLRQDWRNEGRGLCRGLARFR